MSNNRESEYRELYEMLERWPKVGLLLYEAKNDRKLLADLTSKEPEEWAAALEARGFSDEELAGFRDDIAPLMVLPLQDWYAVLHNYLEQLQQ